MSENRDNKPLTASISIQNIGVFTVRTGLNLREALRREGFYLDGTCADKGVCGRCVVRVLEGEIPQPSPGEAGILGKERVARGERLACRITVAGDLKLSVDSEKILEIEKSGHWKETWESSLWNPGAYPLTGSGYGVALDLGTTSFAAALYDMARGRPLDIRSGVNPQLTWGDEIISRLGAAEKDQDTAGRLRDLVWEKVREMVRSLCLRSGVSQGRVTLVTAVANSAIHHLALGLPVTSLLTPPYAPFESGARELRAGDPPMELEVEANASVHFPPLVGGYAGSDALASLLAVSWQGVRKGALMDVGTNTEIVVWDKDRYVLATAPSGPAFEGGRIRDGMRAEEGAIWKVTLNERNLGTKVVGGGPPRGICGTGIVDAIAQLLKMGLLDQSGLMRKNVHPSVVEKGFVLDENTDVILRPEDIATIQEAKAAVASTLNVLLDRLNMRTKDLERVYLSGAFGSRLNAGSAVAIGLLPRMELEKYMPAGNTALIGASYALLSDAARRTALDLAGKIEHISVAEDGRFEDLFLDNLYFPQSSQ